jgi:hypothetical protein
VLNIKECLRCSRIVAIGGASEPHAVLMALEAGADGYLHMVTFMKDDIGNIDNGTRTCAPGRNGAAIGRCEFGGGKRRG